jgi:hypothetical protein
MVGMAAETDNAHPFAPESLELMDIDIGSRASSSIFGSLDIYLCWLIFVIGVG